MNISTETREILRNYRAVINARRREMGQKPLRRFSWAVTTSFRAAETGDTGAGGGGRLSARAKTPGRLTPAGREAGHAGASPVTLPVCDVSDSGVFLSYVMELFLMLLLLFLYLLL